MQCWCKFAVIFGNQLSFLPFGCCFCNVLSWQDKKLIILCRSPIIFLCCYVKYKILRICNTFPCLRCLNWRVRKWTVLMQLFHGGSWMWNHCFLTDSIFFLFTTLLDHIYLKVRSWVCISFVTLYSENLLWSWRSQERLKTLKTLHLLYNW